MSRSIASLIVLAAVPLCGEDATVRPQLAYSQSFGGSFSDSAAAVAVDATGNVYIVGNTFSPDFPVKNSLQAKPGGVLLSRSDDFGLSWTAPNIAVSVTGVTGSPKRAGVLFAGTAVGVYKSIDAGKTWVAQNLPSATPVDSVAIDSTNPAIIYASNYRGIYKTQDEGITWALLGNGQYFGPVASDPLRPQLLLAFDYYGALNRSADGGNNWEPLNGAPDGIISFAYDRSSANVLYAGNYTRTADGLQRAIYKTTNAGTTWTKLADLALSGESFSLAAGATTLYAATERGVLRSRDGGITWAATNITTLTEAVAVDPANPRIVYASAGSIFRSLDEGATWTQVMGGRRQFASLSVVAGSPSTLFVGAYYGANAFVTKWSSDGKHMLFSTFLGGSETDQPTAIAVDRQGNIYVAGFTHSTDFPVTSDALQPKTAGPYSGFLSKISPDGSKLLYSTYLGGSTGDEVLAMALDRSGNVYLTGYTGSADFPVTPNAVQGRLKQNCAGASSQNPAPRAGLGDLFVGKFNAGTGLFDYLTYLGGTCADVGRGIAVDSSGNAYVVGATTSTDFPVTKDAAQSLYGQGSVTGFLAKLSPQGGLQYATYLGGPGDSVADGVALDDKASIYVSGSSQGFDKILLGSPGQAIIYQGDFTYGLSSVNSSGLAYVGKFGPALSRTYLQYLGSNYGEGRAVAVDSAGRAWVTAYSAYYDIPLLHPFQAQTLGSFVSQFSPDGSKTLFSSGMDFASGLALDVRGNVFLSASKESLAQGLPSVAEATLVTSIVQSIAIRIMPELVRIDTDVPAALTVEAPQPIGFHPDPTGGVAAGEVLVLTGTGLGPDQEVGAQIGPDGRVPTSLAGTSVTFDGVPAPLLSVQSGKIECVVPFEINYQPFFATTLMSVQRNGSLANSIRLGIARRVIEVLGIVNADGSSNAKDYPALPHSTVSLFVAGVGQTEPASVDGRINGPAAYLEPPPVQIDGRYVEVSYAGNAVGQVAGIGQINIPLPDLEAGPHTLSIGQPYLSASDFVSLQMYVGPP